MTSIYIIYIYMYIKPTITYNSSLAQKKHLGIQAAASSRTAPVVTSTSVEAPEVEGQRRNRWGRRKT